MSSCNKFRFAFLALKVASQAFTWKISICLAKIAHVFRCSLSGELACGPLFGVLHRSCSWPSLKSSALPNAGFVRRLESLSWKVRLGPQSYSICSIHRMTGWVAVSRILWRMRTAPLHRVLRKHTYTPRLFVPTTVLSPFPPLSGWCKSTPLSARQIHPSLSLYWWCTAARAIGKWDKKFLKMAIAHVDRRYSVACKFEFLNLMSPDADRRRCGKLMRRSHPHLLAVHSAFEKLPCMVLDA